MSSDAAQLAEDEDWLYQTGGDQTKAKKRKKKKLLPPDQAKLIAMRDTRLKERKMYSVIRLNILFFFNFLKTFYEFFPLCLIFFGIFNTHTLVLVCSLNQSGQ